jgi:hypothetical protein
MDDFFSGYAAALITFAEMAQNTGVSIFSIGGEIDGFMGGAYDSAWRNIIAGVRAKFSGKLTFGAAIRWWEQGANINDFRTVGFWDALDYIGFSCYPLWPGLPGRFSDYDASYLFSNVNYNNFGQPVYDIYSLLSPMVRQYGKKILFEEFAFQATSNQLQMGWDNSYYDKTAAELSNMVWDYENQAMGYEKWFQYFTTRFAGLVAGYDPWVLCALNVIYHDSLGFMQNRLSQYLIIADTSGNIVIKPGLKVISNYYSGM